MLFTAEPTSNRPEQWHPLITAPLATAEVKELDAMASRAGRAYAKHRSLYHLPDQDCGTCVVLADAWITFAGLVAAGRYLPVGTAVLYHGSITEAHGVYTVYYVGLHDGDDTYYHLADESGELAIRAVRLGSVTPL